MFPAPGFTSGVSSSRFGGGPSGPHLPTHHLHHSRCQRRCHAAAAPAYELRRRAWGIRNCCRLFLLSLSTSPCVQVVFLSVSCPFCFLRSSFFRHTQLLRMVCKGSAPLQRFRSSLLAWLLRGFAMVHAVRLRQCGWTASCLDRSRVVQRVPRFSAAALPLASPLPRLRFLALS